MAMKNLWGDLSKLEEIRTPKSILKEQAALLAEATRNIVTGEIQEGSVADKFVLTFYLVAPYLNDYRYEVLEVIHGVDIYPATIRDRIHGNNLNAKAESEFETHLESILSSREVRKAIQTLQSQSNA